MKTVPRPYVPPPAVVPYKSPAASAIRFDCGLAPCGRAIKSWITISFAAAALATKAKPITVSARVLDIADVDILLLIVVSLD
jgi:hypothetical protein